MGNGLPKTQAETQVNSQVRTQVKTVERQNNLVIASADEIKEQMALVPVEVTPETIKADPELDARADKFVDMLLGPQITTEEKRRAIDEMGLRTQQSAARQSDMLKEPIKSLMATGEDGGPVASALVDLEAQVTKLDPVHFDFSGRSMRRLLGKVPLVGSKLRRYFAMYSSAQSVIDGIIESLREGAGQLKRDNSTLGMDQDHMRKATGQLEKAIRLAQIMDAKLAYKLEHDLADPDKEDERTFAETELLFPLRQRVIDLQQTLAVNQQGVLTTEIIIRNNRELIRGVNRALNVTVVALQTAVAVALALNNQRIVLDKINALNTTTSDLIAHTAERLKTQGVEIHKQAASSMLDMEKLEQAFRDIKQAMDDIQAFRQQALPQMAQNIQRMDVLTAEAAEAIQKMDRGDKAQAAIAIDIEAE